MDTYPVRRIFIYGTKNHLINVAFAVFSYSVHIWQDVYKLIQRALHIYLRVHDLYIIFELPGEEDIFRIMNFFILYGKKYIFDCRIKENIVSIDRVKSNLKSRLEVEIYITDSWGIV